MISLPTRSLRERRKDNWVPAANVFFNFLFLAICYVYVYICIHFFICENNFFSDFEHMKSDCDVFSAQVKLLTVLVRYTCFYAIDCIQSDR